VGSGVVRVVAATVEAFVPQMVNFELVGGVDFKKGCYPGQEVVARSQYRGTIKRRAVLMGCGQPMSEGQEVFSAQDREQPAGKVALAASLGAGEHLALVEIKLAALALGPDVSGASAGPSLHLGEPDGPALFLADLPYALPAENVEGA
jgi:folate-binding protein YgfZ